ncbi:MAG: transcription-repair coupling factor [Bdellovibrionota bacterium]
MAKPLPIEAAGEENDLSRAATLLRQGRRLRLGGLRASAPAWALARLLGQGYRPTLVLCATPEVAQAFYEDLLEFTGEPGSDSFVAPDRRTLYHLPAWEHRPADNRSPSFDHLAARSEALFALLRRPKEITIVLSAAALLQKGAPREALASRFEYLLVGQDAPFDELPERLTALGYRRGPKVEDRGEFAVKGGLLDIFPPGYARPLRIEFHGEKLESVRPFDPSTQRSFVLPAGEPPIEEILLLPMREVFFDEAFVERAIEKLSEEQQAGTAAFRFVTSLKEDLRLGRAVSGLEYFLPYFYENAPTLLDHLPEKGSVAVLSPATVLREMETVSERLSTGYARRAAEELPASRRDILFAEPEILWKDLETRAALSFEDIEPEPAESPSAENFSWNPAGWDALSEKTVSTRFLLDPLHASTAAAEGKGPFAHLAERLRAWQAEGKRVAVSCRTPSQHERLAELLRPYELSFDKDASPGALARLAGAGAKPLQGKEPIHLVRGRLSAGFEASGLVLLTEEEISGTRRRRARAEAPKLENVLTSLSDLSVGDFVVQADNGVGKFLGLQHLVLDGAGFDFLVIEYAGGDKLYVPATRIGSVAKYGGAEGYEPPLDRMGGARWKQARKKAKESVYVLAAELLDLYAIRQAMEGFALLPPDTHFRAFESAFEFDETPDQARAIQETLSDLARPRPMDRLVCGDVGFGKTEVAIRAAFLAVLAGRQVAVLVPTTVLAEQHLLTFRRRLEKESVRVESLSRLKTAAEQRATLAELKEGKVDVLIGTHRLLQDDVQFKDLGLLVVDEEQRFGVKHKERLKKLRKQVHVLTLTATPIPRTLHMAVAGLRDLSIIATPPQDRLSIRTIVTRRSDATIREAVRTEVDRGGQVFFVHNRIETIAKTAEHLQKILPDVRLEVAHGQMDPKKLEDVMTRFLRGEFQILLCTAIIENGLDIQNANTLIVDRADHFGLSQLYQLRGRVGRGPRRAYAYLLLPEEGRVTADAEKRLAVLQEHTDLGAGFRIATYDLELRGGGNLLGEDQSGHIAAVGLELYTELLEQAVHELKGEEWHEDYDPEVNLGVPAFLPDTYVPDLGEKLSFYKKLSAQRTEESLQTAIDELVDRYGPPPPETKNLFATLEVALQLRNFNVRALDRKGPDLALRFGEDGARGPRIDHAKLVALVTGEPERYRLRPDMRFSVRLTPKEEADPVGAIRRILEALR